METLIGFSRARDPMLIGSWIIAKSENRPYSHAFIIFTSPTDNQKYVFQAAHGNVNLQTYEYFVSNNIIVKQYELNPNDENFNKFTVFINENLGMPYSRAQIVWLTLKKFLQIHKWPACIYNCIKNDQKEEICSELALRSLEILRPDFIIPKDLQEDQFTPSDLDEMLQGFGLSVTILI